MDEKRFNELFEKTEDELKEMRAEAIDRWTWDTGKEEDNQLAEDIEVFLLARERTGLRK